MASTFTNSSSVFCPTTFLGQTKSSSFNPLRDVVSLGSHNTIWSVPLCHKRLILKVSSYFLDLCLNVFFFILTCEGKLSLVWTRQSEVLRTLFRPNSVLPHRRVSRRLWLGHCRFIRRP